MIQKLLNQKFVHHGTWFALGPHLIDRHTQRPGGDTTEEATAIDQQRLAAHASGAQCGTHARWTTSYCPRTQPTFGALAKPGRASLRAPNYARASQLAGRVRPMAWQVNLSSIVSPSAHLLPRSAALTTAPLGLETHPRNHDGGITDT